MKTTLFIADISGFTEFLNETEIIHGEEIIIDLLETIIKKNELSMKIYEIEGDAVVYYDNVNDYNPAHYVENAYRMLTTFKTRIDVIAENRHCSCGACQNIKNLSLKFIVHKSLLSKIRIQNFEKMYGLGLIIAHVLLKNSIGKVGYILFTNDYLINYHKPKLNFKNYIHIDS